MNAYPVPNHYGAYRALVAAIKSETQRLEDASSLASPELMESEVMEVVDRLDMALIAADIISKGLDAV